MTPEKLQKLLPDGVEWTYLPGAGEVGSSRAILTVAKGLRDELRRLNEENPRLCDEDIRQDVRWRLGAIWLANEILGLPDLARKCIDRLPEGRNKT